MGHSEGAGCVSGDVVGQDHMRAKALKRALAQLSTIRHVVPSYKVLHSQALATLRGLSADDDDLSVAGSEPEMTSLSPVKMDSVEAVSAPAPEKVEQPLEASQELRSPLAAKYYEEEDESTAVLAVGAVKAFLSTIGGFSLGNHDTSGNKVLRRRKVKKEAPPPTPEEEQHMVKVKTVADIVLRKVQEQLWSRWGEATPDQKELLAKRIRRGLRHLAEPAQVLCFIHSS